jgi:3-hydroxyisobutyrate dehydrogenase-like beta-hydroxyacid dehydrogenase
MTQIAFLGTGLLGAALAEAALGRGDSVNVWNRSPEKARALEKFGARAASTPADAVRGAERVHLVLKDDAVVEEVIAALRPGLDPSAVIVDHTTTRPDLTAERAVRLNKEGVKYLHCPVFIGPPAARKGEGTIMSSGPKALFEQVKPALEKQAAKLIYFGERPDLAAVYKLCGNALIIGLNGVFADVLAVAKGSDVSATDALRLLDFFNPAGALSQRAGIMANGNLAPNFELAMARKDVRLMLETAGDTPLATLPLIAQRMDALIAKGHGEEDLAAIGFESR